MQLFGTFAAIYFCLLALAGIWFAVVLVEGGEPEGTDMAFIWIIISHMAVVPGLAVNLFSRRKLIDKLPMSIVFGGTALVSAVYHYFDSQTGDQRLTDKANGNLKAIDHVLTFVSFGVVTVAITRHLVNTSIAHRTQVYLDSVQNWVAEDAASFVLLFINCVYYGFTVWGNMVQDIGYRDLKFYHVPFALTACSCVCTLSRMWRKSISKYGLGSSYTASCSALLLITFEFAYREKEKGLEAGRIYTLGIFGIVVVNALFAALYCEWSTTREILTDVKTGPSFVCALATLLVGLTSFATLENKGIRDATSAMYMILHGIWHFAVFGAYSFMACGFSKTQTQTQTQAATDDTTDIDNFSLRAV
jgi:hypothetical protein